jgi:hypothetical protein
MANCAKCGAGVPAGATKCEYCGSVIDLPKPDAASRDTAGAESGNFARTEAAPKFKVISVGLMIGLLIVTLGFYGSVWFFLRRRKFSALSPKASKAGMIFGVLLGVHIVYLILMLAYFGDPTGETTGAFSIVSYVLMGMIIYSAVTVKSALVEFAAGSRQRGDANFAGSVVWTVVFNCLYLQSQINRMIDARVLAAEV